jgi:hypothetical protein
MAQSLGADPGKQPRSAARWVILLLLGCCAALLAYIVITWRTQRRMHRDLKEVTRTEVVKRDEQIAELQARVDRLRQEVNRSTAGRMRVAANDSWLALVDAKGVVSIRAVDTGKELASIKEELPCTQVEVPPLPQRLVLTFRPPVGQEKAGGTTQLWEVKPEKEKLQVRKLHTFTGDQARFSRDGSRCLTRGEVFFIWETSTGRKLASFPPAERKDIDLSDLVGWALSPNGRSFTAETKRGELILGDVDSGKLQVSPPR